MTPKKKNRKRIQSRTRPQTVRRQIKSRRTVIPETNRKIQVKEIPTAKMPLIFRVS